MNLVHVFICIVLVIILILVSVLVGKTNTSHQQKRLLKHSFDYSNTNALYYRLWLTHSYLSRIVMIDRFTNDPALSNDLNYLYQNQKDIGNAVAITYGREAGNKYTELLTQHVQQAVLVFDDIFNGKEINSDNFKKNADAIAEFLYSLDDTYPLEELKTEWRNHVDHAITAAENIKDNKYDFSVKADDPTLAMAGGLYAY